MFTTLMPGGQPQSSLVWCDYDGEFACVNITTQRQKARNLRKDPRATLLIVDPQDTGRYLEIRGRVELSEEGAVEHLDQLTRQYTQHPRFYGFVYPLEQRQLETRLIGRIHPTRVNLDAIHN